MFKFYGAKRRLAPGYPPDNGSPVALSRHNNSAPTPRRVRGRRGGPSEGGRTSQRTRMKMMRRIAAMPDDQAISF